jgi:predicted amidohydrolase
MIAAAVQYRPPKGNPAAALSEIAAFADEAGDRGARIIVFPEMATSGYIWKSREEILPSADTADGRLFNALSPVAARREAWIVCGFPEISNGTLYNSALVIAPDGSLCCCYRKVLLFDADLSWAEAGNTRCIIRSGYGTLAPGICMDLNDDGFTAFAHEHAAVIPFCTNWLEEGLDVHEYWKLRLEGFKGAFIAANSWGFDGATEFCGRSAIFGRGMTCLASAGRTGNCIITAEV